MSKVVTIKTAEIAVGKEGEIIKTGSIGSCLVIALYDFENQIGGLAHAMLPMPKGDINNKNLDIKNTKPPARYIDQAIDNLILGIGNLGGNQETLIAKLAGGAAMFSKIIAEEKAIGKKNITAAHDYLRYLKIPLKNEDVGGKSGKSVEFNLKNGLVTVVTVL